MKRIGIVLRALGSALRGQGFTRTANVIDKIRKGEIAGRYDPARAVRDYSRTSTRERIQGGPRLDAPERLSGEGTRQRVSPPPLSDWGRRLFDGLRSSATGMVEIGDVPEILRAPGGRGKSLTMSLGKVRWIMREHLEVLPDPWTWSSVF